MASTLNPSHIWRNDITGLRAVAVLPVLLFHAFSNLLPGGFLGVDVFFVISGYLISGIIFRGLAEGTFSYRVFYARRIKRIIPNLLLVFVFVTVAGFFILFPGEYKNLGRHIYSSAVFVQNFRLLSEVGYFTEDALRKPLLHLWSLAIEEQFYIVFPIVCALIWKFLKSDKAIGATVAAITFGSLAACILVQNRELAFYFPLTRFWEIGAGIVLAFAEIYGYLELRKIPLGLRHALSVTGLAGILAPMVFYTPDMVHPGAVTLLPVIGAVALIAAYPDAIVNRTLLSWRPMTFVGLISYSLYLWHWPLLSFLFIAAPEAPSGYTIAALVLTFAVSSAVYLYVENPVRRSQTLFGVSTVKILLVGLLLAVACGQTLRVTRGFLPAAEGESIRAISEWEDYERSRKFVYNGAEFAVTREKEVPSILFAGDSHMVQYFRRVQFLSDKYGINAGMLAVSGKDIFDYQTGNKEEKAACEAFYSLISDKRVKTLAITMKWGSKMRSLEYGQKLQRFRKALAQRKDLRVFIILDPPWTSTHTGRQGAYDPLRHFNRWNFRRSDFIVPYPEENEWKVGNEVISKLLADAATIISVEEIMCPNQMCDLYEWYRDDDHLQPKKLEKDAVWLDQIFEK